MDYVTIKVSPRDAELVAEVLIARTHRPMGEATDALQSLRETERLQSVIAQIKRKLNPAWLH